MTAKKETKKVFLIIAFALLHFFSVEVNIISLCFQSCIQKRDMVSKCQPPIVNSMDI